MAGNGGKPSVNSKATITNGTITAQSVAGVKAVTGVSHTVAQDVNFLYRGQMISMRVGEPFVADPLLLAYCAANGIAITAN